MTHRERAIMALEGRQPDCVPTFELSFQITEEAFGERFCEGVENNALPEADRRELCRKNAELYLKIAERYDHSITRSPVPCPQNPCESPSNSPAQPASVTPANP